MEENRHTPYCEGIRQEYRNRVKDLGGNKEILSKYENMLTDVKVKASTSGSIGTIALGIGFGVMAVMVILILSGAPFIVSWGVTFGIYAVLMYFFNKYKYDIPLFFRNKYYEDDLKVSTEKMEAELMQYASERAELAVTRYLDNVEAYTNAYITSSNVAKLASEVYYNLKWLPGVKTQNTVGNNRFTVTVSYICCGKEIHFKDLKWNNLPSVEATSGLARAIGQLILMQLRLDYPNYDCNMEVTDFMVQYSFTEKPKEPELKYTQLSDLI